MTGIRSTKIIQVVSDNPFIRISQLALKLGTPRSTIKKRVYKLKACGRLVLQKRSKHTHIVTSHYARKHKVADVYVAEPVKSTLELQMMFNSLTRLPRIMGPAL